MASEQDTETTYDSKEPLVIVKPKAYLKMMRHVLRFGSMGMDKGQYRECMGMLMGKLGRQKAYPADRNAAGENPVAADGIDSGTVIGQ